MQSRFKRTTLALSLLAASGLASAQTPDTLKAAVEKALQGNPEVSGRLNGFRAAGDEVDAARGAYYPRVDLSADVGYERDRIDKRNPQTDSLNRRGVQLSATQLLWDGWLTRSDVDRAGHGRLVRYFEFVDTTEQVALEAARAHQDVARFRTLVKLAEDNYVQHKLAFDQIGSRVRAGVGRGVDLEQASARLALAEANLATEVQNEHDVTARYQRVIGEPPPPQLGSNAALGTGLAADREALLTQATQRNAGISASIENLRLVRAQREGRESAFQPRVEARLRTGYGNNFDGVLDQKRDSAAEVVLNWNLFNGGSDQARVRQVSKLLGQAADQRDTACRNVRQTAAIAWNDSRSLVEQIGYLQRNVAAIVKTRDAYQQQFDIGQRSLLDLLNAENEVYTARRALANAESDLAIAQARSHATSSSLTAALGLARPQGGDTPTEAENWQAGEDAVQRCPLADTAVTRTPRSDLDARARALAAERPARLVPTPANTPVTPLAPVPPKAP